MNAAALNQTESSPPMRRRYQSVLIVGCGRSHRQDDQVGLHIAELLKAHPIGNERIESTEAPGADLLADIAEAKLLVIVDVARANGAVQPGHCQRFDLGRTGLTECNELFRRAGFGAQASTHGLGISEAVLLGKQLGILPPDVWLYAVAGCNFGYGGELSAGVDESLCGVAERIRSDIRAWLERDSNA